MSAVLITVDNYLPLPTEARFVTMKDDNQYLSLDGARSYSFYERVISIGRNYRDGIHPMDTTNTSAYGYPVDDATPPQINTLAAHTLASDEAFKIPPKNEKITVTYMIFWSEATGSGDVIAMMPASRFDQFSATEPTRY